MTRSVAFVGPLPPPLHGFSNVCAMMLELLKTKMPVHVFDRAPRLNQRLAMSMQQLLKPFSYLADCILQRNVLLYLALSGGRGQIIDFQYLAFGKLFRRPIFIHHHSFAYINAPSVLSKCLFSLVRKDTHIVLSKKMGESLSALYGLPAANIRVVSNAAFYDLIRDQPRSQSEASEPLHLGFLSNITFEKGFVEFFGILKRLKDDGIGYRAHIAGPLSQDARQKFDELFSEASDTEYVGPVYGADKERFYQQLDVFIFPTHYLNEAEPLVVFEAMRRSVYVIACNRGAIAEMLANGAGLALTEDVVVESAVTRLKQFSSDRGALAASRQLSLQQAQRIRYSGTMQLEKLMASMQGEFDLMRLST
jgi:glycosyltransferase involved in cell wall biosynthesis